MRLTSSAFAAGETIPMKYTCDGEDVAPPLSWSGLPEDTVSLVLLFDDPDAPGGEPFTHWLITDLPPDVNHLPEGFHPQEMNVRGIVGRNDFGRTGYGGPCPPVGSNHTYYIRLYALDALLDLPPGATRAHVMDLMQDHIIEHTEIQGSFGRQRPQPR